MNLGNSSCGAGVLKAGEVMSVGLSSDVDERHCNEYKVLFFILHFKAL